MQPFSRYSSFAWFRTGACSVRASSGVALLATGFHVFRIIHWPEPVLIAAVSLFHRIHRAAIAAVAGRAAKLFHGVKRHHFGIRMAGEWSVGTFREAQIGLGQSNCWRNHQRVCANVAGLAAIDQANAAEVVDRCSWGIYVHLAQFNVEVLDAVIECSNCRSGHAGQILFDVGVECILGILGRLIDIGSLA